MVKIPHFAFRCKYNTIVRELATEVIIQHIATKQELKVKAIWDTGATNSVITSKVFNFLQLPAIDEVTVSGVSSINHKAILTIANLLLPNKVAVPSVRFTVDEIGNTDVLIGMDIISKGDFAVSNGNGHTEFSFAIPAFENSTDLLEKAKKVNERNKKHFPPQFLTKSK